MKAVEKWKQEQEELGFVTCVVSSFLQNLRTISLGPSLCTRREQLGRCVSRLSAPARDEFLRNVYHL